MCRTHHRLLALVLSCVAVCSLVPSAHSEPSKSSADVAVSNPAVTEWFAKYDQIRSDAEMATGEKLKYGTAMKKALKSDAKLSPAAAEFLKRMAAKYAAASTALGALTPPPETRDLQEGYIKYFRDMEKTFTDGSNEETGAAKTDARSANKERIEALNNANKKLDENLRKKFGIPKHKHS